MACFKQLDKHLNNKKNGSEQYDYSSACFDKSFRR